MSVKCDVPINKCNKFSSTIPTISESFLWQEEKWKKIELRFNVFQKKIYSARKDQRLILKSLLYAKLHS